MNKLVIIGAGGHGRVVADVARLCGYTDIFFLDDADAPLASGKVADRACYGDGYDFFVAVGNNTVRRSIVEILESEGRRLVTLIHPNAVLGSRVRIGLGTVIMAGAVINADATVGRGVILNTCCSVDHDDVIGDFCHVSVGAHLAGGVRLGDGVLIGAGATVIQQLSVAVDSTVGAGATVVRSITEPGVYIGVPARRIS